MFYRREAGVGEEVGARGWASWNPKLLKPKLSDNNVGLRVQLPSSAVNLRGISLLFIGF